MNIIDKIKVGEKYYTTIYGDITITDIKKNSEYPIRLIDNEGLDHTLTKEGYLYTGYGHHVECVIFPSKENRDWSTYNYNKFNISTLEPFDKVLVRDSNKNHWTTAFYSHYEDYEEIRLYIASSIPWNQCVPYNEETKHLVGTAKMPDSKYINW